MRTRCRPGSVSTVCSRDTSSPTDCDGPWPDCRDIRAPPDSKGGQSLARPRLRPRRHSAQPTSTSRALAILFAHGFTGWGRGVGIELTNKGNGVLFALATARLHYRTRWCRKRPRRSITRFLVSVPPDSGMRPVHRRTSQGGYGCASRLDASSGRQPAVTWISPATQPLQPKTETAKRAPPASHPEGSQQTPPGAGNVLKWTASTCRA